MPESQARFTGLFNPSFASWKRSPSPVVENLRTVLGALPRFQNLGRRIVKGGTSNVCRVFFMMMFKRRC
jgi:hypothetical protein